MVAAISLYRGNLHRVPNVPRQWRTPDHNISVTDFKSLLHRRSKALTRHLAVAATSSSPPNLSTSPNPNPNLISNSSIEPDGGGSRSNDSAPPEILLETDWASVGGERPFADVIGDDCNGFDPVENGGAHVKDENLDVLENPNDEANKEEDLLDDKVNRKKEVEEKLKVLNEKKHGLVQVLKQILHVEEELKRRSSLQGTAIRPSSPLQVAGSPAIRPSSPLQVDASVDIVSTRLLAPRISSEVNAIGDTEGGEADDLLNHNVLSRRMLRNSSMSPSSESPLRRPAQIQSNMGPDPSRANLSGTGSPSSCLPSTGQTGLPPNLPTVSVSGTNYIASSPSPAASGGTSVLGDARQPSPWN